MRTYTVTKREGELLGPVDYTYPFITGFDNHCCTQEKKQEYCERSIELMHQIEDAISEGRTVYANTYGYFHEVIAIGMYDGWPFWKPTPAILTKTAIGSDWQFFYNISSIKLYPQPNQEKEEK